MMGDAIGTIATAGKSPVGSWVQVVGVVVAMRQLGRLSFILLRDAFSEIQAVLSGEARKMLKDQPCPFYATVSGVLRRRPAKDVRADAINGSVEIDADTVHVHRQGGRSLLSNFLNQSLRFTAVLQSLGFLDVHTLAKAFAPSYSDLISGEDLGPAKHLTCSLGPCRWYLLTDKYLYFGLSPGYIVDLKGWLAAAGEVHDGTAAREILERASWYAEHANASVSYPPVAYGAIPIRPSGENPEIIGNSAYWRGRYSIAHLSDAFLDLAANHPKIDDVAVHRLQEGLARGQALLQVMSRSAGPRHHSIVLRGFPPEFDLQVGHMEELLALFPSLEKHLARSDREKQFEILWSILGHDHVKAIFSSPGALELLSACVRASMFSDYNVLRSLDHVALKSISSLTRNFSRRESIEVIDELFRLVPGLSASACYLMEKVEQSGLNWRRCVEVAKRGVISELAFKAVARDLASADDIASWRGALASKLRRLFTNDPVHEISCRSALMTLADRYPWVDRVVEECSHADLTFDLVNLTFGTGLVAYEEAARIYSQAEDCSHHWELAGIKFGGERWNGGEGRFDLTHLDLYPAKNRAAILAKSSSGICSARDARLFHRKDHFQFTLVERAGPFAAGSVQLYTHRDEEGRKIWVVRGLNPSEKVAVEPIAFTIEVLDTVASMARHNCVRALVCADGAGLFHADSGRDLIRTVIRRLAATAKRISFKQPLHVFDYHDRPISIESGWQVWP
jgi:hypothetical protein